MAFPGYPAFFHPLVGPLSRVAARAVQSVNPQGMRSTALKPIAVVPFGVYYDARLAHL
jgi:hypothetical protein